MCPLGVSLGPFLLHRSFPDSYVVLVFGWDSVVVEGWSSCFLVGCVVVFWDKVWNFGELILSVIALPGDL
ncbi:hypothetical protein DR71_1292 [Corynebacterium sp. ATCC 6931]|nr:hypothetical protein DR71_1292 [Corynebacterium sp. ATCC 6931]